MDEETPELTDKSVAPARADGALSGLRLLRRLDERIREHQGGRAHSADGQGLLKALDQYLETREVLAAQVKVAETKATRKDIAWLWTLIAGVLLLGTLIPDSVFEKIRYKEYGEKVLTYAVGAGLLTKWVRSPQELIKASRTRWFHWLSGSLLAISSMLAVDIVKVNATWEPTDAEVYLDGSTEPMREHVFRARLKSLEVRLLKPEAGTKAAKVRERFLTVSLLDLLSHAKPSVSGLLVEQKWRLPNDLIVDCIQERCFSPVTLHFTLQGASFDDPFTTYLTEMKLDWQERPASFDLRFERAGAQELQFLPGRYNVVAHRENCTEDLRPLDVGDRFAPDYNPEMRQCVQ